MERTITILSTIKATGLRTLAIVTLHDDPLKLPTVTFESEVDLDTRTTFEGFGEVERARIVDRELPDNPKGNKP